MNANTTKTAGPPTAAAPPASAAGEAPLSLADKVVVILFLVGVAVFGLISLVDLISNFFR